MRLLREIHHLTGNYHVKSGMYHYYRNEFKQADEYFRKALRDENLAEADRQTALHYLTLSLMDLAEKLIAEGELELGLEQLRQAVAVNSDYPDIHFRLGRLLETLDAPREAIAAYRRAISCQPDYLDAHVALGFCLLEAGHEKEATDVFGEALRLKRGRLEGPFAKAVESLGQGENREASNLFHETFLASPELSAVYRKKAMEWLKTEEYSRALEELDRALAICPKYPDLHNLRGVVLCELERVNEAIDAFRLSASLSPQYLIPRLNLAFGLVRAEQYREAEAELEAILQLDPTVPAASAKLEELRTGRPHEKRRRVSRGSGK